MLSENSALQFCLFTFSNFARFDLRGFNRQNQIPSTPVTPRCTDQFKSPAGPGDLPIVVRVLFLYKGEDTIIYTKVLLLPTYLY